MLHRLLHYLIHQRPELTRRPRQFINPYDMRDATHDQVLIMKAVKARTPEEAERLLKESGLSVYELLAELRDEKPNLWQRMAKRFVTLIMRIEGASWQHPVHRKRKEDTKLEVEYRWEE
jgi:hypothetical protein